jgi:hypothetical protein
MHIAAIVYQVNGHSHKVNVNETDKPLLQQVLSKPLFPHAAHSNAARSTYQ